MARKSSFAVALVPIRTPTPPVGESPGMEYASKWVFMNVNVRPRTLTSAADQPRGTGLGHPVRQADALPSHVRTADSRAVHG